MTINSKQETIKKKQRELKTLIIEGNKVNVSITCVGPHENGF